MDNAEGKLDDRTPMVRYKKVISSVLILIIGAAVSVLAFQVGSRSSYLAASKMKIANLYSGVIDGSWFANESSRDAWAAARTRNGPVKSFHIQKVSGKPGYFNATIEVRRTRARTIEAVAGTGHGQRAGFFRVVREYVQDP